MKIAIENEQHWHELRQKHIGASEVGALANCSPWATAYTVYHVKQGNTPAPAVSDDVENGRDFEEVIALRYAKENNLQLVKVRDYHECDNEPFLGATLDYYFESHEGKKIAAEIKFVRSPSWRHYQWDPGTDYMPPHIEMQIVAQLLATGWDEGRVVAFCDGDFYSFTRRIGDETVLKTANEILELVADMKRRLKDRDAPAAFGKSTDLQVMGLVAPVDKAKPTVDLTQDRKADEILHTLKQAQDLKYMAEQTIDTAKAQATELLQRASNEPAVSAELLTEHYRLKRSVSQTAERVQTVKAHSRVVFTVKAREDKPVMDEPVNPIAAG